MRRGECSYLRCLATRVIRYGARLHELLGSHAETKEAAARALGKNFDVDTLQKHLHRMVESVAEQTEQMNAMLANVEQDQANLQSKIDKKKSELDRHQKRLQSLQVHSRSVYYACPRGPVRFRQSILCSTISACAASTSNQIARDPS